MRRSRTSKGRFTKSHKPSKRRKARRRRNGGGLGRAGFAAARAASASARPKRRRRKATKSRRKATRRRSRKGRRIRPTVLVNRNGRYYRPARSKYFKRPRRINRRRRNGGSLMSTIKRALTVNTLTNYLGIGGGIFIGSLLSKMLNTGIVPFTNTFLPTSFTSALSGRYVRPFHGFVHIILGLTIASKVRNKHARDVGAGIAALGGFDLLTQLLGAVGMVGLPTFSGMNVNMLGRSSGKQLSGMNADLSGMNVDMLGGMNYDEQQSDHLADNINYMMS